MIRPIINEHWHLIQCIIDGKDAPGLAYIKYDPLVVAINVLGIIEPKEKTEEAIASCIINKYYPELIC